MSYFISEDMVEDDFEVCLEALRDWCCTYDPELDDVNDKEYLEYRINKRKDLAKTVKAFCIEAKECIAELEANVAPYIK